ncbi:MAG: tetratricopeptide repeat protein [Candidatus Firestonebacteria bacterium]
MKNSNNKILNSKQYQSAKILILKLRYFKFINLGFWICLEFSILHLGFICSIPCLLPAGTSFAGEEDDYNLAFKLYNDKAYILAEEKLRKFLINYPWSETERNTGSNKYSNVQYLLGECLYNQQKYNEAIREYKRIVLFSPVDSTAEKASFKIADCFFEQKQYKDSAEYYLDFVKKYPKSLVLGDAYFWLAESYFNLNQIEDALKYYENAIAFSSKFLDYSYYSKAWCLIKLNNLSVAIETLRVLIKNYPDGDLFLKAQDLLEKSLYHLATEKNKNKEYNASIDLLLGLFQDYPATKFKNYALYLLAHNYYAIEKFNNAKQKFLQFTEEFPKNELTDDSFYWAGWCEYKQNNFAGAILKFENLDEKSSLYPEAQFRIGESYYNLKNYMKAQESYKRALDITKDVELIVQLHYSLGWVLYKSEKYKDAADSFKKAGDYLDASYMSAIALYNFGEYKQAKQYFSKLGNPESVMWSGWCEYRQSNYDNAIAMWEKINTADSLYAIGLAYFTKKDFEKAVDSYEKFITKFPKDKRKFEAKLKMADSWYNSGNFGKAIEVYDDVFVNAIEHSNILNALHGLQWCYETMDNYDKILDITLQYIRRVPKSETDLEFILKLGDIYFRQQNYVSAIAEYEKIIKLYPDALEILKAQYQVGECNYKMGNLDSALQSFKVISESNSESEFVEMARDRIKAIMTEKLP